MTKTIVWLCKCDCGNNTSVEGVTLRAGNTKSCGCIKKERDVSQRRENKWVIKGDTTYGYTTFGTEFIIDTEDLEMVRKFCWHTWISRDGQPYVRANVRKELINEYNNKKHVKIHSLILNHIVATNGTVIDHIDQNPLNNKKNNLRICSLSGNNSNIKKKKRQHEWLYWCIF